MSPNQVIHTENLTKAYGDFLALQGIDLAVPRHSITGFLGPNGAGKSTAIKLLLGLRRPTAGSGAIFGLDIIEDSTEIRRRTGYLAQSPRFYDNLTARETLRFVARFFYDDPARISRAVDRALELVDLQDRADRVVRGFSGGERQRLGIAQAQINRPELLILDEPAAALDPMGREQVLSIMEDLRAHSTIFYSTHILDDVQRVSDRVVILNQGRLVAQGPIQELLAGDGQDAILYQVSLVGNAEAARARLSRQPWVSDIRPSTQPTVRRVARNANSHEPEGAVRWLVAVTDETSARSRLLRLLLSGDDVDVLSYGRAQVELEDFFMQLIREENHE
ncbi:MAG TPA: ABC transporter ATP-binding protein [Candidatus Sulfomarinibacteraceae bacterium]|nr:ABC transporter ATP-binding protein [Candidatus Sulfomarinibacteraceae bacterium]